jgi:hypothetical protein
VAAVQLGFDSTPTHGDKNIYAPDSLWTMCYSILDYHPEKKAPDVLLHRTEDCRPRRSVDEAVRVRSNPCTGVISRVRLRLFSRARYTLAASSDK